jgi:LPS export ABC transporter protein LptC
MKQYFVIFFLGLSIIYSCKPDTADLKDSFHFNLPIPSAIYTDYEIIYNDSGLTQVKIAGDTLEQFNSDGTSEAQDRMKDSVHLWFYDENMVVKSELIADNAIRNRATGYMEAFGNVIVYNNKGEKLNTEHLIWDEKKGKILSNDTVTITKEHQVIKGKGLESDQNFIHYEIRNVHGILNIDKE